MDTTKITVDWVRHGKTRGEKVPVLTAYDYPLARLLDEAGVPVLLVGDSLGMVVLGYPDTTHVTMAEMEHHVRAVARAKPKALVVADLPYHSYQTPEQALENGRRLTAAGAEAVKLEGGVSQGPQIAALVKAGISVMGHLGMLPQSVKEEGGYKIKGKGLKERNQLLTDAQAITQAGVFAMVLELVTPPVAEAITASVTVPTIGIGSGSGCDGQVLVTHDLVGGFPWFKPKFAEPRATTGDEIRRAAREFCEGVTSPPSR
jgi:3-methyl-2-oxobutanoate hydroxymethyltransferase